MYLHLGNDVTVNLKSIVGIFDMDNTTISHITRDFFSKAQKAGYVIDITEDLPKSFILTEEDGEIRVYISSLASKTLYKRASTGNIII